MITNNGWYHAAVTYDGAGHGFMRAGEAPDASDANRKAREQGLLDIRIHDLRDHTHDRHRTVDDEPYGGGPGMVMRPEPWGEALDAILPEHAEPAIDAVLAGNREALDACLAQVARHGLALGDGEDRLLLHLVLQHVDALVVAASDDQRVQQCDQHTEQAYDTFFVEVVSAQADERVFSRGRWNLHPGNADLHTLHHLGAGLFAVAAETVQGRNLLAP